MSQVSSVPSSILEFQSPVPLPPVDPLSQTLLCDFEYGGIAYTSVPETYAGPCRMVLLGNCSGAQSLVFADKASAECAARFAVGDLGGYRRADVECAPGAPVDYADWHAWALF